MDQEMGSIMDELHSPNDKEPANLLKSAPATSFVFAGQVCAGRTTMLASLINGSHHERPRENE